MKIFNPYKRLGFFVCRCWCFHQSSKDGRFKTFGVWCGVKKISPLLPLHKMKILYRHRLQTGANRKIFQNLKSTFLENAANLTNISNLKNLSDLSNLYFRLLNQLKIRPSFIQQLLMIAHFFYFAVIEYHNIIGFANGT